MINTWRQSIHTTAADNGIEVQGIEGAGGWRGFQGVTVLFGGHAIGAPKNLRKLLQG